MNSKNLYIAAGALAVAGLGGFAFLTLNEGQTRSKSAEPAAKALESVSRREAHVERLQGKLRGLTRKSDTARPTSVAVAVQGEQLLVATDVSDINTSEWVQSMYDTAFVYEGPIPTKAELEKREQRRIGVHTEEGIREKEEALAAALPAMQAEIDQARKEREAEQKRFEKVGMSPAEKAARDGVELEY